MSGVDPQFYRTAGGMGLPAGGGYAGYATTGLLHSGLGGPTPFMPPNHLTSFAPKVSECLVFIELHLWRILRIFLLLRIGFIIV